MAGPIYNPDEGGGGGGTENAVKYTYQNLTPGQKEQAQKNIGTYFDTGDTDPLTAYRNAKS